MASFPKSVKEIYLWEMSLGFTLVKNIRVKELEVSLSIGLLKYNYHFRPFLSFKYFSAMNFDKNIHQK